MNLPRTILLLAVALFAVSVAAIFLGSAVILFFGDWFWGTFALDAVIRWGTAVLSGLVVSSALLLFYLRDRESYMTFEEIVLLICLGLSAFPLTLFILMATS